MQCIVIQKFVIFWGQGSDLDSGENGRLVYSLRGTGIEKQVFLIHDSINTTIILHINQ